MYQIDNIDKLIHKLVVFEAVQNIDEAVIIVNFNFDVIYTNTIFEKLFNTEKIELNKIEVIDSIIPEKLFSQFQMIFNEIKNSKNTNSSTFESHLKKLSGEHFPVEITLVKMEYDKQDYLAFFIRDISKRIEAQNQMDSLIEDMQVAKEIIEQNANEFIRLNVKLQQSEEQLQELNNAKDKFFSIIAHDLRNPLQAFLSFSNEIKKNIDNLNVNEIKEFIIQLNESAEVLYKLMDNLLQWSRLQRGVMPFHPDNHNINFIIQQNIDLAKLNAKEKNIKIVQDIDDNFVAYVDINMIDTILRNLISNAIKFTLPGGTITIKVTGSEKFITISVIDTGVGMADDVVSQLFSISHKHTSLGTTGEQGTGLGLILCKEMIEQNGGTILIKSEKGVGSNFSIKLPVAKSK